MTKEHRKLCKDTSNAATSSIEWRTRHETYILTWTRTSSEVHNFREIYPPYENVAAPVWQGLLEIGSLL